MMGLYSSDQVIGCGALSGRQWALSKMLDEEAGRESCTENLAEKLSEGI